MLYGRFGSVSSWAMKLDPIYHHLWTFLLAQSIMSVETRPLTDYSKNSKHLTLPYERKSLISTQGNAYHHSSKRKRTSSLQLRVSDLRTSNMKIRARHKRRKPPVDSKELNPRGGEFTTTHTESYSNSYHQLDVSQYLAKDGNEKWKDTFDSVFPKRNFKGGDKEEIMKLGNGATGAAMVKRSTQTADLKGHNGSFLHVILNSFKHEENTTRDTRPVLTIPFKKNPLPQKVGQHIIIILQNNYKSDKNYNHSFIDNSCPNFNIRSHNKTAGIATLSDCQNCCTVRLLRCCTNGLLLQFLTVSTISCGRCNSLMQQFDTEGWQFFR